MVTGNGSPDQGLQELEKLVGEVEQALGRRPTPGTVTAAELVNALRAGLGALEAAEKRADRAARIRKGTRALVRLHQERKERDAAAQKDEEEAVEEATPILQGEGVSPREEAQQAQQQLEQSQ